MTNYALLPHEDVASPLRKILRRRVGSKAITFELLVHLKIEDVRPHSVTTDSSFYSENKTKQSKAIDT